MELSLANKTVSVQHCTLVSEDTHFTLTGTASSSGDRPLDLRAERLAQPETGLNA